MKSRKKFSYIDYYRKNWWAENGVSYSAFVSRMKTWWSAEEAIRKQGKKIHRRDLVVQEKKKANPDYYIIDIKYKSEEATVFASIYEEMLKEIEEKYYSTDEPQEALRLLKQKHKIEREYDIFLTAQI